MNNTLNHACISLKQLYESGYHLLKMGGIIVETWEDERSYYDLCNKCGDIILCDGESVKILSQSHNIIICETNASRIYFTKEEFNIAAFGDA